MIRAVCAQRCSNCSISPFLSAFQTLAVTLFLSDRVEITRVGLVIFAEFRRPQMSVELPPGITLPPVAGDVAKRCNLKEAPVASIIGYGKG
jgi:hypothetical protein